MEKSLFTKVFESHRKSLIQQFERSELRLHFEWTKHFKKVPQKVHYIHFCLIATKVKISVGLSKKFVK